MHCCIKDVNTGDNLVNASGHTVLAVAARRGDKETMRYAVHTLRCSTADITDVAVLQRGLHAALEVNTSGICLGSLPLTQFLCIGKLCRLQEHCHR
jgi:hypothetical protein